MKVTIIFHSGFGHTEIVARQIAEGAITLLANVELLSVTEALQDLERLNDSDTLVFGSPTYFGNVSAEFKRFMDATGSIWFKQLWRDKLAAGFTNSSSTNGDKLHTLTGLQLFASQHGMTWLPLGLMPRYDADGHQLSEHNGMASYIGLMTQSPNEYGKTSNPSDLGTARLFGARIAERTLSLKSTPFFHSNETSY